MDTKKLQTLQEMTEESFRDHPEQAPAAVKEYLDNIEKATSDRLSAKLEEDEAYHEKFKIAITHTSLMVFIAYVKATTPDELPINYEKYISQYLADAQKDDKDIYDMRTFYLSSLTADEMSIGEIPDNVDITEETAAMIRDNAPKAKVDYDNMRETLLNQYQDRKAFLLHA